MTELILYHHLGLGDHFICNGLVNKVSEQVDELYLICKEKNFDTVSCLYKDNYKVNVIKIKEEPQDITLFSSVNNLPILTVGFTDFKNPSFDRSFYVGMGLDFSLRYSNFKLPKEIENSKNIYDQVVDNVPYCLVHNVCSDGEFNLNIKTDLNMVYIKPGLTKNLLDYVKVIENASEIHCVDSSVFHLIDSMEVNAKLYFHDIRSSIDNKIRVSDKWIKV